MPGYRYATASGNWSNTATWDQGILPIAGDYVVSNNFTVTIDTDINVGALSTTNAENIGVIPAMTSANTPAGYVAAASTTRGVEFPYLAFDHAPGTFWTSNTGVTVGTPQWLQMQFPSATVINRYRVTNGTGNNNVSPSNWTFEGSNDGTAWTVLHTVTGAGMTSTSVYLSPLLANTTTYLYYRINVTAVNSAGNVVSIAFLHMLSSSYATTSGSYGGGFSVTGSRTITLTSDAIGATGSALVAGLSNVLTYSGPSGSVLTLNAGGFIRSTVGAVNCLVVSGSGTANITGVIPVTTSQQASIGISQLVSGSTINFTGNIFRTTGNATRGIVTNSPCSLSIIGDVESGGGSDSYGIIFNSTGILNITGNVIGSVSAGSRCAALYFVGGSVPTIVNITGNITGHPGNLNNTNATTMTAGNNVNIYVTGNVTGGAGTLTSSPWAIYMGVPAAGTILAGYLNIVGSITAGYNGNTIFATNMSTINLFTGPFINGIYGSFPLNVGRMHYIKTANSYFEFRDSSTNGALPPGAIAPTASMFDPSRIVDAPTSNNVRSGISYALGSQTGTLVVPSSSSVAAGVTFDNGTVGTAVLTAAAVTNAIWNQLVTDLTGSNSIGARVANCSTVSTTGAQIASLT